MMGICACGERGEVVSVTQLGVATTYCQCEACEDAEAHGEPFGADRVKRAGTPALTLIFQSVPDVDAMTGYLLDHADQAIDSLEAVLPVKILKAFTFEAGE